MKWVAGFCAIVLGSFIVGLLAVYHQAQFAYEYGKYDYTGPLLVDFAVSIGIAVTVFLAIFACKGK